MVGLIIVVKKMVLLKQGMKKVRREPPEERDRTLSELAPHIEEQGSTMKIQKESRNEVQENRVRKRLNTEALGV